MEFKNEIKDVKLLLLTSIKMKFKDLSFDRVLNELKKYYKYSEWNNESEYASYFNNFQNFMLGEKQNKENFKIRLGTFDFSITYNGIEKNFTSEVFLFFYPSLNIINILYNITLDEISVDELIYIRKVIQFNKESIVLKNNGFYKVYENNIKITFNDISMDIRKTLVKLSRCYKYAFIYYLSKLKKFEFSYKREDFLFDSCQSMNVQKMMVVEVRNIGGMDSEWIKSGNSKDKFSRMIYGMLVCDEGYNFVPDNCIYNTLKDNFSSRDYFRVYASNIGVVMINLVNSNLQLEYEEFQKELGNIFNDKNSQFICSHPEYAGLEHGALLALERATMLFVIINSNLIKEYFSIKRLNDIIKNRQKMIEVINLTMNFNILSPLTEVIMQKMGIFGYVERVRERLDIAENDTLFIYQKRNNYLTLLIAVIGLIFAAMSISEIKEIIIKNCISLLN